MIIVKNWANGDPLTLETGAGGISVSSVPNLTGEDREMDITVRTTNPSGEKVSKVVNLVQRKKQGKASYWVDTSGGMHYFELENTPVANFCTAGNNASSVIINGLSVVKNTVKDMVFGDSYNITSTPGNFLRNFNNIVTVDLLHMFKITSIGTAFLLGASNLTTVKLSAVTPPTLGSSVLSGTGKLESIYVPAESVELYKTATNWNAFSDKIKPL